MTTPLITFAIPVFNTEDYIQEAVEGAFSQTYSPLQIILSDDGSSDRTFEIMQNLAAAYHGPHEIVLNRSPLNIGVAGQWNQIMALSRGEFVISAGGDDISLPNRTEIIWKAWEDSSRKSLVIQSASLDIDKNGNPLSDDVLRTASQCNDSGWPKEYSILNYIKTLMPGTVGCAFAFSPLIFSTFGPLSEKLVHEDDVITLRALCLGSIAYIPIPLVKRRFHTHNSYSRCSVIAGTWNEVSKQEDLMKIDAEKRKDMYSAFLEDIYKAKNLGFIDDELWLNAHQECKRQFRIFSHQADFINSSFWHKIKILFSIRYECPDHKIFTWMLLRMIPRDLFRSLKTMINSIRIAISHRNSLTADGADIRRLRL